MWISKFMPPRCQGVSKGTSSVSGRRRVNSMNSSNDSGRRLLTSANSSYVGRRYSAEASGADGTPGATEGAEARGFGASTDSLMARLRHPEWYFEDRPTVQHPRRC